LKETGSVQPFTKTITIDAPASEVWKVLTDLRVMKKWMLEEELEIITDWKVGNPILIKGTAHWVYFENSGRVLKFEPGKILQYTHLSSLSKLPDLTENYCIIEFKLSPQEKGTDLTLTLSNFPTESIYKHLVFYWNTTLGMIRDFTEKK